MEVFLIAQPIHLSELANFFEDVFDTLGNLPWGACSSSELLLCLGHIVEIEWSGVIEEVKITNFLPILRSIDLAYHPKLFLTHQEVAGRKYLPELFG